MILADAYEQSALGDRLSDDALASAPWRQEVVVGGTMLEPRWFSFVVSNRAVRVDVGVPQEINADRLVPAVERLVRLLSLPENWDSYGAPRINPQAAEAAVGVLTQALVTGAPMPEIVPTNRGMVQLEWHQNGIDLEVEVMAPGRYLAFFRDRPHAREVEAEVDVGSPVLREFLDELSLHARQ